MPTSSRLRRTVAMTAAALTTVTGGIVLGTGTAQANTHLVGTQLIVSGGGPLCLDSNAHGSVYVGVCNGGPFQRWNVTSYDSDVNNYYSRVQIQDVATKLCLRIHADHHWYGDRLVLKTDSCDYRNVEDQWNMTWVGNVAGNPSNGVQFFNKTVTNKHIAGECLTNTTGLLDKVDRLSNGMPTCQDPRNQYQVWKTQG
ncbi:hypothetical protein AB0A70_28770 [Streptomyces morookaense]|uniref:hypothetical protein n=1 Tax=Streptomyces morookaense TaxID=1970 RepID=UPI00340FF5E1